MKIEYAAFVLGSKQATGHKSVVAAGRVKDITFVDKSVPELL